jgi:Protein of unknown function (DUF2510)
MPDTPAWSTWIGRPRILQICWCGSLWLVLAAEPVRRVRPSRLWYWVAAALAATAVVCLVLAGVRFASLIEQTGPFERVAAPGRGEVVFDQAGQYVVYLESSTSEDLTDLDPDAVRVRLVPVDSSDQVRLSRSSWQSTYTRDGYYGQAVAEFTIVDPGPYTLTADDPTDFRISSVAIGRESESAMAVPMLLGLGAAFLLLPAALVTGLITLLRRQSQPRLDPARIAGWRPDPSRRHMYRYWDGARWTEHVSDPGVFGIDPP